jgi:putative membrane protein
MDYSTVKALHIIFVITWFAGLFYIVRLFIYQTESYLKQEPERSILTAAYKKNSRPLWYGITWPSMVLTLTFGFWMLLLNPALLQMSFMQVKLGFVLGLLIYHFICHYLFRLLQNDVVKFSSIKLRIWNEVATVFLVAIVFIVILKSAISWMNAFVVFIGFSILLFGAVFAVKKIREKNSK